MMDLAFNFDTLFQMLYAQGYIASSVSSGMIGMLFHLLAMISPLPQMIDRGFSQHPALKNLDIRFHSSTLESGDQAVHELRCRFLPCAYITAFLRRQSRVERAHEG